MLQHIERKLLEVSEEPALATDIDGIHNIPTHNQDHALKSPSAIPRQMTPGAICCQASSSLRLLRADGGPYRIWTDLLSCLPDRWPPQAVPQPKYKWENIAPNSPHSSKVRCGVATYNRYLCAHSTLFTFCNVFVGLSPMVPSAGLEPARPCEP